MKKNYSAILLAAILVVGLSACGQNAETNRKQESGSVAKNIQISPAKSPLEVLVLIDQAFNEHDFNYLRTASIEPYWKAYMKFILSGATEEDYWTQYDERQGSYFDVGTFISYTSEVTKEERIEDLKTIEEELLANYQYSCTIQDAYDITYNRLITGTTGSNVNEGYQARIIQIDGFWYCISES